jgi:hypothetical protein
MFWGCLVKTNVGPADRFIRVLAGVGIIAAGIYLGSWWGALGAVPLLTGLIGWCPPYALFGISTCRTAG